MLNPVEVRTMLCDFIGDYAHQIAEETSGAECAADNKILLYIAESLGILTDELFDARAEAMTARISDSSKMEE